MRSPKELVFDAFALVREHIGLFAGIYVVPAVIMLFGGVYLDTTFDGTSIPTTSEVWIAIVLAILMIVVSVVMSIAMIRAVMDPTQNVQGTYRASLKHFWQYFFVMVLVSVAVMFGFILLIVPGIIFMVWFAFSYYVLLEEDIGGTKALARSKVLVSGRWWAVFGRLLLWILLTIIVTIAGGIIGSILAGITNVQVFVDIMNLLINIALVPASVAYMYFMYQDLKSTERTEGNTMDTPQSDTVETFKNEQPTNSYS